MAPAAPAIERRSPCCGANEPLLRCVDLEVGYKKRPLLPPINFTLRHHQLCAVVGRNGAGKTTWFKTLLGLLPPISGLIEKCSNAAPMAYIPQRSQLDPLVPLRAWDVVAMGAERGGSFLRPVLGARVKERVSRALAKMEVADLAQRPFSELSEGQKQRVLFARLLTSQPELAVLDEPTAAMDEVAERETLELIDQLRREHDLAVMIVSHHLPVVSSFADQVIFLDKDSQSVVAGPPEQVFSSAPFIDRYGATSAPREARDA